jgi:hypothetical protein
MLFRPTRWVRPFVNYRQSRMVATPSDAVSTPIRTGGIAPILDKFDSR